MKLLAENEFLRWARERGLGLDARYPQMAALEFQPASDHERFWCIPDEPQRRPYFISSVLEFAGPWDSCFAWRHLGRWPSQDDLDARRINDVVEFELLKSIGIPLGTAQIPEFQRDEVGRLVSLLFVTSIFGWSVGDDLYVVPDNARYILMMDHHGVIHVQFRNEGDINAWVSKMTERGFSLPDDLPDETFKRPSWMTSKH
jgi:hypothetical protein